jgi:hypothetical protein
MVIDAREVFRLLLVCVLGYAIWTMGARLRLRAAKVPFAVGYVSIVLSSILTIVEDLSPSWIFLHLPQHSLYVVAGAAFALAGWRVRSAIGRSEKAG